MGPFFFWWGVTRGIRFWIKTITSRMMELDQLFGFLINPDVPTRVPFFDVNRETELVFDEMPEGVDFSRGRHPRFHPLQVFLFHRLGEPDKRPARVLR